MGTSKSSILGPGSSRTRTQEMDGFFLTGQHPLDEKIFDLAKAHTDLIIEPDCMIDDLREFSSRHCAVRRLDRRRAKRKLTLSASRTLATVEPRHVDMDRITFGLFPRSADPLSILGIGSDAFEGRNE